MGTKKTEKFGEELLNIIVSYCKKENIEPPVVALTEQKIQKKIREDTKKLSFDLFKEGKTVAQIAEERMLSINTIEGHLGYYLGTGEIPLRKFVSQEKTDLIAGHLEGDNDLKAGPVKAGLGEQVSWGDIKFVINHLMFLRKSNDEIR